MSDFPARLKAPEDYGYCLVIYICLIVIVEPILFSKESVELDDWMAKTEETVSINKNDLLTRCHPQRTRSMMVLVKEIPKQGTET